EGLKRRGHIEVVARADQHVIANDHGGAGDPVVFIEGSYFLLPDFLAGGGVETEKPVILLAEVEAVIPHGKTSVAETVAGAYLPEVVPEELTVMRVDGIDVA